MRTQASPSRVAVFLDRDGVINIDTGYPHRPADLRLTSTAAAAISMVNEAGYPVIIITNQSGVARGLFTLTDVETFHAHLRRELAKSGAHIDAIYVAPYHPDGVVAPYNVEHEDRKPGPGMLLKAISDFSIDATASLMIGDKPSDAEAAKRAGVPFIRVATNECDLAGTMKMWLANQNGGER